jgi:hypothetical protein
MPRLRTLVATFAVISSAVVIWTAVAHSQSQVPGLPSPGAAPVLVVNDPTVHAVQSGPWQVSIAPDVAVTLTAASVVTLVPPDFLRVGRRYVIQLSGGAVSTCTIDRIDHGWVRATDGRGTRWLNLALVVSVQDAQ